MNADKAVEYLTRVSWRESRLGLARMEELLERLGNPQRSLKFIHVAGTNGKGSVSAMLASILKSAGYKTGLYTSPYIQYFHERMQVDGALISERNLVRITEEVGVHADAMEDHPTEFEMITVVAIVYFLQSGCDIVVFEVGLGGRLDATNIIPVPEAAVITAIGLDHTKELGDTLEQIAAEKAGIIKPGGDAVLYPQQPSVEQVVREICKSVGANLHPVQAEMIHLKSTSLEGQTFSFGNWEQLHLSLLGGYQLCNAATALETVHLLQRKGWKIPLDAIRSGLAETRWPARFERVHRDPDVIVDGGHNPQCVGALVESLSRYYPGKKATFLLGVMADKDYAAMLELVRPLAERIITVTPDNSRAMPADALAKFIRSQNFTNVQACNSVEEGLRLAAQSAGPGDLIVAFGSFYMAGAIRTYFGLR